MTLSDRSTTETYYRGPDRRQVDQNGQPGSSTSGRAVQPVAVTIGAALLCFCLADDVRARGLMDGLAVLQAALLTAAGLLCLVRWRLVGLARPALIGVALIALGALGALVATVTAPTPLVRGVDEGVLPERLLAAAVALTAASLLAAARGAPAVDAGTHPTRLLRLLALGVPVLGTLAVLSVGEPATPEKAAVLSLGLAGLWLALAVTEHRLSADHRAPWLPVVLLSLSASELLHALATGWPQPAEGVAAALLSLAGGLALHGAYGDVLASLSAQSSRLLRLTTDVREHRDRELTSHHQEQEQLHEVRNVLAGLQGATATLRTYEDRLDPGVRRRLEDAVSGELRRLSALIDPAAVDPVTIVDLARCLAPVITFEREQGADLRVDLQGACVRARTSDVATLVSALLVNARRHAPGSRVDLRTEVLDGETRVLVEDRGPGIALEMRTAVFERGERCAATVTGSGLGLYVAQRLATDLDGTLRVDARPGGGASFVLTLPCGSVAGQRQDRGEDPAQAGQVAHGARAGLAVAG